MIKMNNEDIDIKNILFPYRNQPITCIGDSFTHGAASRPDIPSYVSRMEKYLGTCPRNTGIGGATIAKGDDDRGFIGDQIQDVKDQKVITIFGGTNDFASNRPIGSINDDINIYTFCGSFKYMITNLASQNPFAKLLLITPAKSNHAEWRLYDNQGKLRKNKLGYTFIDYVNAIKQVGNYFSIPVLDIFNVGNYNPYLFPKLSLEGLHPNAEGHERLAKTIAFKINSL
ncbi:MAG TPA: SGNH/GDSL hydrolase family protein [Candidatus Limosilactobacillus excrementigallinarum]|nr:SGNH/GDSL hydrolase family protein [Candidatus Limosilactobacillus excrementigallinarum]